MKIKGMHNVFNVVGAIAASREFLKIPYDNIIKSIANFTGVPGRMETLGFIDGKKIIVDYAHNPGGVETVLREFKRIYGDFTLIITISSESGEKGDLEIFDLASKFSKYIIPSSKASQRAAMSKVELKEKILINDIADFNKEGTLGASYGDVLNGFKIALKTDTKTIIAIGEAAIKFKNVFNDLSQ
jgi:UDP-N-acetylmuramate--alanine ligase